MNISKIYKSFKKNIVANNRGSAMITALAVGVVIAGFCLSALLVSYTLFIQTSRQSWQLQTRNTCQSFMEIIVDKIEAEDADLLNDIRAELVGLSDGESKAINYRLDSSGEASGYDLTVELYCTKKNASSCNIVATVRCIRGASNDADVQSYTITHKFSGVRL